MTNILKKPIKIYKINYINNNLVNYMIAKNGRIYDKINKQFISTINSDNEYSIVILNNIKYFIHELVANTFCPKPTSNYNLTISHIDNDKSNNSKYNLKWIKCEKNKIKLKQLDEFIKKTINFAKKILTKKHELNLSYCHYICKNINLSNNKFTNNLTTDDLTTDDLSINDLSTNDLSTNDLSVNDLTTDDLSVNDLSTNNLSANNLSVDNTFIGNMSINNIFIDDMFTNNIFINNTSIDNKTTNNLLIANLSTNDISIDDLSINKLTTNCKSIVCSTNDDSFVEQTIESLSIDSIMDESLFEQSIDNSSINSIIDVLSIDCSIDNTLIDQQLIDNSSINSMMDELSIEQLIDNSLIEQLIDNSLINSIIDDSLIEQLIDNTSIEQSIDNSLMNSIIDESLVEQLIDNSLMNSIINKSSVEQLIDNSSNNLSTNKSSIQFIIHSIIIYIIGFIITSINKIIKKSHKIQMNKTTNLLINKHCTEYDEKKMLNFMSILTNKYSWPEYDECLDIMTNVNCNNLIKINYSYLIHKCLEKMYYNYGNDSYVKKCIKILRSNNKKTHALFDLNMAAFDIILINLSMKIIKDSNIVDLTIIDKIMSYYYSQSNN